MYILVGSNLDSMLELKKHYTDVNLNRKSAIILNQQLEDKKYIYKKKKKKKIIVNIEFMHKRKGKKK